MNALTTGLPALKPCPFCGGKATLEEVPNKTTGMSNWTVGCVEEDGETECMGYQSLSEYARKIEAVNAWNLRHVDTVLAAVLTPENLQMGHAWLKRKLGEALNSTPEPVVIDLSK